MRISDEQVSLFKALFKGRTDVYGTYDPISRKSWQVKRAVTDQVIRNHLEGRVPFGVYLLDQDRIGAVVVDFDQEDTEPPLMFQQAAGELELPAYIERSKSKGYHVWMFFAEGGMLASKARRVATHLLRRIKLPQTEVFPKQDRLYDPTQFGNFINTPLFGRLVQQGRSVFLDENLVPHFDQWDFLKNIARVSEAQLDRIIADKISPGTAPNNPNHPKLEGWPASCRLPPCAQRMLDRGVAANQRVACFRLACQLRKIGVGLEQAARILLSWAHRNHPLSGKGIIRPSEVHSQVQWAYQTSRYRSCGCEDPAVTPFCDPLCRVRSY